MAMYRKLGKKTKLRKALLRNQVTALIYHGRITTTEARAKEIRKIVEPMITMAVKERDNFETVTVKAKVARKDKDGKRVKEIQAVNGARKNYISAGHTIEEAMEVYKTMEDVETKPVA